MKIIISIIIAVISMVVLIEASCFMHKKQYGIAMFFFGIFQMSLILIQKIINT